MNKQRVAVLDYVEARVLFFDLPEDEDWTNEKVEEFLEAKGLKLKDIYYMFGDIEVIYK